jgi:hypothetical protein
VCCPEISNINREQWPYSAHVNGMNVQTILLPVVLYGCETLLLTLREEHRLKVLRILEPKRIEVTGDWRKLHNKELIDLYCSPTLVWVIKWRRMRWVGHVAHRVKGEAYTGYWWGNLRERDHLGDPGVFRRIILRWVFRKWDGCYGLD